MCVFISEEVEVTCQFMCVSVLTDSISLPLIPGGTQIMLPVGDILTRELKREEAGENVVIQEAYCVSLAKCNFSGTPHIVNVMRLK